MPPLFFSFPLVPGHVKDLRTNRSSSLQQKTLHLKRLIRSPTFRDITLCHNVKHLHNLYLAASLACKN